MAKSVLTHLDFKSVAQLKNALLDIRSTMPTGVAGQVAYNSTTKKFGYHNGTEWVYPGDYSLPTASSTVLGGVKVGSTLAISNGVLNQKSGIATAGTYRSVTVDTYGRVTSGTNPTTLSGYGITDAKIQNGVITLGSATITPMTNLAVGGTGHTDELAVTKGGATSYLTVPFATKATKDGSNNVIADTYATKTQLGNAVPDNMTTAGHLLLSTAEGGKSAWSAWTTKGILQTSNTGVVSVKTPTLWGVTFTGDNVSTAPNLYIGTTKVQTSSAAQHVTGVASLTIGDAVLSWDSTNKALKLTKRDGTSSDIGFWAEGFVSAFGPSSTEGGGTDITAEDIISILNAYTPGEKIKAEVLNVAGGGGLAWTDLENATSISHVIDNSHLPSSITGLVSKVAALESSAVTGATITGSGNAVTSVSKSGNTITFTKGSSFPVLDNGKIPMSYMPDAILGQVIYGGTLGANALATLTANAKAKLGTTASTLTLSTGSTGTGGYTKNEGIYYIASASQTFGTISLQVGDWLLSTGSGWTKIDNTDAVTGVKGNAESSYRIGNINITPANIGKATTSALGCVQIGSGLSVDGNGIVSIGSGNVTNAMLAGSIALSKLNGGTTAGFLRTNASGTLSVSALSASDIPSITKSKISDFPTALSAFTDNLGTNPVHTHFKIVSEGDNRNVATKPSDYFRSIKFAGLKTRATIGNPSSDTYSYAVGLHGWGDYSGGFAHEFAFNDSGINHRIGTSDTAWGTWKKFAYTSDLDSLVSNVSVVGNALRVAKKGGSSVDLTVPYATESLTVKGEYTQGGGQQNPSYFGKNHVGFLMMNTPVDGDTHYKDWLIMDCYNGSDVGGAVAIGVCRQSLDAFIMGSDATRASWSRSARLYHTANANLSTVDWAAKNFTAAGQITSSVATGTAPFVVASTTAVANLNADLLDGYHATDVYSKINYSNWSKSSTSGTAWFTIYSISDNNDGSAIFIVKAYAHSSLIFSVTKGYSSAIHINILGGGGSYNGTYAHIKGVRVKTDGSVQIGLNATATAVSVSVRVLTPRLGNSILATTLTEDTSGTDVAQTYTVNNATNVGMHISGGILSDSYIRATGNITGYYSSSDLRLKKNFTDLNLELDAVANLPLKSYDRTDCGDKRTDGTIAQDVQKLLPNEVYDRGDGYLAMAEGQLGLIFGINAHKEILRLRKRVEELERRLN